MILSEAPLRLPAMTSTSSAVTAPVILPVARVALDVSLPHLDRLFDYAVPDDMAADAVPGARVRARFAGRLCDGFVLERALSSDVAGSLAPLARVVSPEPVLTASVAELVRKVAQHYAGTFADVVRLAVPPRHATTEKAPRVDRPRPLTPLDETVLSQYPTGDGLLAALRSGQRPRAAWTLTPSASTAGDWVSGFVAAAGATLASGRGALLLVPDARDVAQLETACAGAFGVGSFATLTAEQGPAARYRAFLAALRGDVPLVLGTRAAAFAPVQRLGLVALWDAGDDLYAEQRAPYPHTRDVVALRATTDAAALLFAGYHQTTEVAAWLERGWLTELTQPPARRRRDAPAVKVAVDSDAALERDPVGGSTRLPHEVFTALRTGLAGGAVLVQVPRRGYLVSVLCDSCRTPARCGECQGPLRRASATAPLTCGWCGASAEGWACPVCGGGQLRSPRVGSARTAEELGRAFPQTKVVQSAGDKVVAAVRPEPALVVATPAAEPLCPGGYAAAVLLDAELLLQRGDLRASEEALRRWLNAAALVRPGTDGGTVVLVGPSGARAVQALVRLDAAGFAVRELNDRRDAGFPPAAKLITVEGAPTAVADFARMLEAPPTVERLGPVPLPAASPAAAELARLMLRTSLADGDALTRAVKATLGVRSARKDEGALRVRVDPAVLA